MAINVATLTSGADLAPAGATSNTASITPNSDRSTYLVVLSDKVGGALAVPTTPTSNGLTWVQVATITFNPIAVPISRLTVFRGAGSSPTAGVIPITHASTPTAVIWWVLDNAGGPITSSAVVQSATGRADAGTTASTTLATYQRTQNGALAATAVTAGITPTAGAGWTDLGTQSNRLQLEWRADNDTTPDSTFATSNWAMISVELAADFYLAGKPPLEDAGNAFKARLWSGGGATSVADLALNAAVTVKTSGAAITGTGTISGGHLVRKRSGGTIAGIGTISGGHLVRKRSGGTIVGTGTIVGDTVVRKRSGASFVGTGSLVGDAVVRKRSGTSIAGSGTLIGGGFVRKLSGASTIGTGTIVGGGVVVVPIVPVPTKSGPFRRLLDLRPRVKAPPGSRVKLFGK